MDIPSQYYVLRSLNEFFTVLSFVTTMMLSALLQSGNQDGKERREREGTNAQISWTQFVNDYLKKGEVSSHHIYILYRHVLIYI